MNREKITAIFVDIEDSTGISNYFERKNYQNFLLEFHKTIQKVLENEEWKVVTEEINHKFMGDEFIAFFPHKKCGDEALEHALRLAATLKYEWYFSKHNQKRLWGDKEHIELNIGINTGDVSLMSYPILSKRRRMNKLSYEGFPITMAKRIQGAAEESQGSRIIIGDRFYREYSNKTKKGYEFHYLGLKTFKGIAQRFSCYEWLGGDFYEYLDFKETKAKNIEKTLIALYNKNPHNPWYAALLANYYYLLGEEQYYEGKYENENYNKCEKVCINAISDISMYNLRKLNEILFTCLEVGQKWDELCFRSEQAFNSDPTFVRALANHAKSLYMRGDVFADKSKDAAERLIILFCHSLDYESLWISHFILARYYAKNKTNVGEANEHLKKAVDYAKEGKITWAYREYEDSEIDFKNIEDNREFKKEIAKLEKMWKEH